MLAGTAVAACLALGGGASAQMRQPPGDMAGLQALVATWPEASRTAAADMMMKYGPPQEVTADTLVWRGNGPWKWTILSRVESDHAFPAPHKDVLEQAIDYKVPLDRYDDLARYDGSVHVRRTQGELSARCDMEGLNLLAINLAHDVAQGRRSVDQARDYYARAVTAMKASGRVDPYMQGLAFKAMAMTADSDTPASTGRR